jgi:mannosyl-3-phosphoglycerate phosphatase family protein
MTAPARQPVARCVVFTDLDGTLLDARTYSAELARPALGALAARAVPVVFCSSKTGGEQRQLQAELGLAGMPLIVENGAAVIVPAAAGLPVADWPPVPGRDERVRILGRPAADVRAGIARVAAAAGVRLTGYSDLSAREVAALTGLDEPAAARARQREFSETIVAALPSETWARLESRFADEGLLCQHGGRFHTVTAAGSDKGRAARLVADLFAAAMGEAITTVGLGDGANDAGLLAAVDRPYLVSRDSGGWAKLDVPHVRRIAQAGPRGWCEAIEDLLAHA